MADQRPEPPPITVLLPDGQKVVGRLHERQQTRDTWLYRISLPAWQNTPQGRVDPAWYMVWVQAPDHVRPVDGVAYEDVPTTADATCNRADYLHVADDVLEVLARRAVLHGRGRGARRFLSTARRRLLPRGSARATPR